MLSRQSDSTRRPLSPDAQRFLDSRELFGWQLGLSRVKRLSRLFGDPHRRYAVIHIAGTNGKGSTAATLEAILKSAGFRTGLYTSPHLVSITERIRIDGLPLSIDSFELLLKQQQQVLEKNRATYFEALTMIAFSAFAEAGVDIAVVEVGLGGRLDATNIVHPVLSIIPSIAFDHQKYLGKTLSAIAAEKAGIVKRRVPCVIGKIPRPAARVIEAKTKSMQSQLYDASRLCKVRKSEITSQFNRLWLSSGDIEYDGLQSNLVGRHQINNTLCAITGVSILNKHGIRISDDDMKNGLRTVEWPGRFQIVQRKPAIVFDVAHNPAGMRALVETFREVFPDHHPVVLFGVLADKDYRKMLDDWQGVARHFVFCRVQSSRALQPEKLHKAALNMGFTASVVSEASVAFEEAKKIAGREGIVCVAGSHYTVGGLMECINAA
jgi:dihydrofolate synthase/folylpolyglutamate synthase